MGPNTAFCAFPNRGTVWSTLQSILGLLKTHVTCSVYWKAANRLSYQVTIWVPAFVTYSLRYITQFLWGLISSSVKWGYKEPRVCYKNNCSYNLLEELVIIKVNYSGEAKSCPVSFWYSSSLSNEICKLGWKFWSNHVLILESNESAISSLQSLSRVQLFSIPWIIARQASLSITSSRSSLKLMSIELVMPSSHLILCRPLIHLPPISPSIRVFSNESTLHMRWPKYWSFSFSISPFSEHPGLISFRMDWLDLLAVQRTLKSLLQHDSSKASILQCSAFFTVQLSHPFTDICKASSDSHFAFLHVFPWGWSWSLSPVQCHEPPSIVHQALCLSDLVP